MELGSVEDGLSQGEGNSKLDAVRVLHQSVVTLRAALEQSKSELTSLKEQLNNYPELSKYTATIESLSIENHVLREKVLSLTSLTKLEDNKMSVSSNDLEIDDGQNGSSCSNDVFEDEAKEAEHPVANAVEDRPSQDKLARENSAETPRISKGDSEESEEVDDIELIFTTDDTKELGLQEDLVSIAESDNWSKADKDEEENIPSNLKQTWSQSVLVETDISKCGVVDSCQRIAPVIMRESPTHITKSEKISKPIIKFSDTRSPNHVRPILVEKNCSKQESEAQTDITALPLYWRSEGYLAHTKLANLTTLPSKFAFPFPRKQSLRLSEKTQEARRVLLSDINFTSMVPELSRSADHICQDSHSLMARYPRAMCYMKDGGGLLSPGYSCECRHSCECCSSFRSRRHSTRPSLYSLDRPPSSVPSSPTHSLRSRSVSFSTCYRKSFGYDNTKVRTPSAYSLRNHNHMAAAPLRQNSAPSSRRHVKFSDPGLGQSLPDLHSLGGSTDSLIAESEDFLRHSIDSILSFDGASPRPSHSRSHSTQSVTKRLGEPFIPKAASELRVDYWVKVITGSSRVETGKVRYVGPVPGSSETHVGVQLNRGLGNSDGSHRGAHFFSCEPDSAIFVPFKKVILAWCG